MEIPSRVELNNGCSIPVIGLGTSRNTSDELKQAVYHALKCGYRHIDAAYMYQNEDVVGAGIQSAIQDGVVKREDIFVTSKLWNTFHRKELVKVGLKRSLKNLGVDYLDLYLLHWPTGFDDSDLENDVPKDEDGNIKTSDVPFTETWAAMEECVHEGLVRSIGLSNFTIGQIQMILDMCSISPVVLQSEAHPYLQQKDVLEFCQRNRIVFTAYSPLVSPERVTTAGLPDSPNVFQEPLMLALAEKYKKTVAQVVLRWLIQRGFTVIPKSVTPSRIEENMKLFDFVISQEDMDSVDVLERGWRAVTLFHPLLDLSHGNIAASFV